MHGIGEFSTGGGKPRKGKWEEDRRVAWLDQDKQDGPPAKKVT